ncbi:hypothetical protein D2Q93_15140 [Alicyclobacillaceae bacterium I2511]|nr:hypothetical protein D2Q93_15140 [Alicyclobacillaceae bacterium I2511]
MKVGMIGLGEIAEKAYLPVIGTRRDILLHIATRNRDTLERIGEQYRIPQARRVRGVEGLLQAGVEAVFVHTATESHFDIVHRLHSEEAPDIVLLQKNRVNLAGDVRSVILGDFIHVIDTLRFFDILSTDKSGGFQLSLVGFPASLKLAFSLAFQLSSGSYGLSTG